MPHDDEVSAIPPTGPMAGSTPAARMRAHRERRRLGLRCVTVQLRETEIDVLIRTNLLKADARNDARAVRDALHTYLDRTLSRALLCVTGDSPSSPS
jgi:hypothetical protein